MALKFSAAVLILFLAGFLASCSGGNPVASDLSVPSRIVSTGDVGGEGVFMRARVHLDTDTLTATLTPYRSLSAVGDLVGDLEITSFLTIPFCTNGKCMDLIAIGLIPGTPPRIGMTFEVVHPFELFDPLYDPTGTNRADLDLFDLRMYLVNNGGTAPNPEKVTLTDFSAGAVVLTPGFVANADGYDDGADAIAVNAADGLDAAELLELTNYNYSGTTTMQPYKRIFDGTFSPFLFTPGGLPLDEDNRMSHGDWDDDTFVLNLAPGSGTIDFDLAIAGSYGVSAKGKWNRVPEEVRYFGSFRAQRPFVSIQDPPTSEGNTGIDTLPSVNINVMHPWTGLASASSDVLYKGQANNGMLLPPGAKGPSTGGISIEGAVQYAVDGFWWFDWGNLQVPTDGDGTDANPWRYSLPLEDPANPGQPIPDGTYNFYIYVTADTGTSTTYPAVGTDNYTIYYAAELYIHTNP